MTITWAARDLITGRRIDAGGSSPVPAASLIKLPIMLAVLQQVDDGRFGLEDELEIAPRHRVGGSGWLSAAPEQTAGLATLVTAMIDSSDNAATNVLLDAVGYPAVNAAARRAGMRATVLRRHMMDLAARRSGRENVTTASDVCAVLGALTDEATLSPGCRRLAYAALLGQTVTGGLSAAVPPGLELGHKTGELDGIRHDAGLLFRAGTPVVALAVCGTGAPGAEDRLEQQLTERARAICDRLGLTRRGSAPR